MGTIRFQRPEGTRAADREIDDFITVHARAQGDEKLVQLRERLDRRIRRPGT